MLSSNSTPSDEKPDDSIQGIPLSPARLLHSLENAPEDDELDNEIFDFSMNEYSWDDFDELIESINSDDNSKRDSGLAGIRMLLGSLLLRLPLF